MRYWLIEPAKKLLTVKHGEIAAIALATNYIEGIEIYTSGKDSKGRSKEFFRRSYKKIFAAVSGPDYMQDAIANALYDMLRCGFAHDGMFRSGIYFSTVRKEAMLITWPKKNGRFDPDGKLESAIINPKGFVRCIEQHYRDQVAPWRTRAVHRHDRGAVPRRDLTHLYQPGRLWLVWSRPAGAAYGRLGA